MIFCRDVTPVASQRIPGIDGILDFGDVSGFNRLQCVRDWSGILCERERERCSGTRFFWTGFGKRDENEASKDIAESPTAKPERPD